MTPSNVGTYEAEDEDMMVVMRMVAGKRVREETDKMLLATAKCVIKCSVNVLTKVW